MSFYYVIDRRVDFYSSFVTPSKSIGSRPDAPLNPRTLITDFNSHTLNGIHTTTSQSLQQGLINYITIHLLSLQYNIHQVLNKCGYYYYSFP